jgi:RNA polymerase sigma-70 factor (ECF subfamily)
MDGNPLHDDTAIRQFVREDYPRVVNAVAFVAGSLPAAEDLVQEALARAWTKTEPIESLTNWVTAVALNLSRSRWRRISAERRATQRFRATSQVDGPSADAVDVRAALAALPRRQREVAVLRYLMGMSTREVAETLRIGEGTVKNSLSKARDALARRLQVIDEEVADDVEDR